MANRDLVELDTQTKDEKGALSSRCTATWEWREIWFAPLLSERDGLSPPATG